MEYEPYRNHSKAPIKTILRIHTFRMESIMTYRKKYKDPKYRGGFPNKSEGIHWMNSFWGNSIEVVLLSVLM